MKMIRGWLSFCFVLTFLLPAGAVLAQDPGGNPWANVFDAEGNLLPSVVDMGTVFVDADWMDAELLGMDLLDASFHQYVTAAGDVVVLPSASTLFFMVLHPNESGWNNSASVIQSGTGLQVGAAAMLLRLLNGTTGGQNLLENMGEFGYTNPDQFADAVIAGEINIWSLGGHDVQNILQELLQVSLDDGMLATTYLIYLQGTCETCPTGCPENLCAIAPQLCETDEDGEAHARSQNCPEATLSQLAPTLVIAPVAPPFPVVVGQDPERRGVDIAGTITVPPVVYTWYEPVYAEEAFCAPLAYGHTANCARGESGALDGELVNVLVLSECISHVEYLPEPIVNLTATAGLSGDSQAWIINNLGGSWYGAYIHQGGFDLLQYGSWATSCGASGTCTATLTTQNIPFADPGDFELILNVQTAGAAFAGTQLTQPRLLTGQGLARVAVILPSLIDAGSN